MPSLNFTPWRRVKVQSLPSGLGSHLVASAGSISALPCLVLTRPSKICLSTRNVSPSVANAGSNSFGSPAAPNTMVSLLLALVLSPPPVSSSRSLLAQPESATVTAATAARTSVLLVFEPGIGGLHWVSGSPNGPGVGRVLATQ